MSILCCILQLLKYYHASRPWCRIHSTPKALHREPKDFSAEEMEHELFQTFLETRMPKYVLLYHLSLEFPFLCFPKLEYVSLILSETCLLGSMKSATYSFSMFEPFNHWNFFKIWSFSTSMKKLYFVL